jgi:DNA-binding CsgD family transcriptional regulator
LLVCFTENTSISSTGFYEEALEKIPHNVPDIADYELTPHETRLLRMLVEGHSYKTGAALGVSLNTIKFHLRRIYDKLQVHTKSEPSRKLSDTA